MKIPRLNIVWITVLTILVYGCNNKSDSLLEKGTDQFEKGNFKLAAELFNQVIEKDPHNLKAYLKLASADACMNHSFNAFIDEISKIGLLNYHFRKTFFKNQFVVEKGYERYTDEYSLDKLSDLSDEIDAITKAIAKNPSNPYLYLGRAFWYKFYDQTNESLRDIDKAIELKNDFSDAYVFRGMLFYDNREFNVSKMRAFFNYRKAFQINNKNIEAIRYTAMTYTTFGERNKGYELLGKILEINPDDIGALKQCVEYNMRGGDTKLALQQIEKLLEMYPNDPRYLNDKGNVLLKLGNEKEGIRLLRLSNKMIKERGGDFMSEWVIKYYLESHGKKYIPPDQE